MNDFAKIARLPFALSFVALALYACDGAPPDASSGGGGSSSSSSSTGGSSSSTTLPGGTGGGGSTTSTTEEPPCEAERPLGCAFPDPDLGFDPAAEVVDVFGPILPWRADGASVACLGPFAEGESRTRALVGFGAAPPEELELDVWSSETGRASGHAFVFAPRILVGIEPGPDGLSLGVYEIPATAGPYVCVAAPLSAYAPPVLSVVDCQQPLAAQWLGLPWTDANGDETPSLDELSVAPLACPLDVTTDDGTPTVAAYDVQIPYGVRP